MRGINNYKTMNGLVREDFLRQEAFRAISEEDAQKWAFGSEDIATRKGQRRHRSASACMLAQYEYQ